LNAELIRNTSQILDVSFANDKRATIKLASARFERLFRGFHLDVFQTITQRDERVVGVVIDHVDGSGIRDATWRAYFARDTVHWRGQHFRIDHTHDLD